MLITQWMKVTHLAKFQLKQVHPMMTCKLVKVQCLFKVYWYTCCVLFRGKPHTLNNILLFKRLHHTPIHYLRNP